jgi:hypothetical protein
VSHQRHQVSFLFPLLLLLLLPVSTVLQSEQWKWINSLSTVHVTNE